MKPLRDLRGYSLGLIALIVALSTGGYFYAGQLMNSQPPQNPRRTLTISTANQTLDLKVIYAFTPRQWISSRQEIAPNEGVLYAFPNARDLGWSTQSYSFPISVAFLDRSGTIVRIMDMEPCAQADPQRCPIYEPKVAYRKALEVRRGWFEQNKVKPGDKVTVKTNNL